MCFGAILLSGIGKIVYAYEDVMGGGTCCDLTKLTPLYKNRKISIIPNILRKERVPVSIYLVNGIKLQGQIDSFDQFVVLLKNTVSQMVYKHAISTVVPSRAVNTAPISEQVVLNQSSDA